MKKIGAYVMMCEEDAHLLDSFLENARMVGVDVAWQLDHCSPQTKEKVRQFERTVYVKEEDTLLFQESFRQNPFCALEAGGYDWVFHWDIDERWDKTADLQADVEEASRRGAYSMHFPMFTAWGNEVRIDGLFDPKHYSSQSIRERMFNLQHRWRWRSEIVVTPYLIINDKIERFYKRMYGKSKIIHYGLQTKELRQSHKKRWDTNYARVAGKNPYDLWDYVNDEGVDVHTVPFEQLGLTQHKL